MGLSFEWDEQKAEENLSKHEVSFAECTTIFGDPWSLTIGEPVHSIEEDRLITVGLSNRGRVLVVVHTERRDNTRLATPRERKAYGEGTRG